ncbi:MAG: HAD family hydrolase [Dehalococcoidia bacterium]|nr:HAD family hydrolase [Dehalococcoidia bacterium]
MANFTAVTFDMWETVVTDPHDVSVARDADRTARMAAALGMQQDGFRSALDALRRHLVKVQRAEGDLGTPAQLEWLLQAVGAPRFRNLTTPRRAELTAAYVEPLFEHPPLLVPGVDTLLRGLAEADLPVGLICNTGFTPGSALRRLLGSLGVLDYFSALFFSGDVGISKPAVSAFSSTLERLKADASSTVHIGDNPATDVAGARRAGMHTALLYRKEGEPDAGHDAHVVVRSMVEFAEYLGIHS